MGKEDYAEARKQADAIVQRGAPDDRAKAAAVYARILLGLGQTDGARQYLAMQTKQGFAPRQAAIYAAWLVAADGKPDEAAAVQAEETEASQPAPGEGGAPHPAASEPLAGEGAFAAWATAHAVPIGLIGLGVVAVAVAMGSLGMKRARHRKEVMRRYRP